MGRSKVVTQGKVVHPKKWQKKNDPKSNQKNKTDPKSDPKSQRGFSQPSAEHTQRADLQKEFTSAEYRSLRKYFSGFLGK